MSRCTYTYALIDRHDQQTGTTTGHRAAPPIPVPSLPARTGRIKAASKK